jgi:hypothetical protein
MQVSNGRSVLNPYIAVVVGLLSLALYVATTGKTIPNDMKMAEAATIAAVTTEAGATAPPTIAPPTIAPPTIAPVLKPPTQQSPFTQPPPLANSVFATPSSSSSVFGPSQRPIAPPYYQETQSGGAMDDTLQDYNDNTSSAWAPMASGATVVAATVAEGASLADVGGSVVWTLLSIIVGIVVFFGLLAILGRLGGVDISAAIRRGIGSTPGLYDVTLSKPSGPVVPAQIPQPVNTDEVFQVGNGNLTYVEAQGACQAEGSKLASYTQIENAYNNGAEWCSYGWSDGQLALFPTQKATYERLQAGCTGSQNSCGRPGINGGYIANQNVRFAANCYGKKPKATKAEERALKANVGISPEASEATRLAQLFKAADKKFMIRPFASGEWSSSSSQNATPDMRATLLE